MRGPAASARSWRPAGIISLEGKSRFEFAWAATTVLPFLVAAAIISPVLTTGFYGDDASDANLNGALAYRGTSLIGSVAATAALWIHANGRLFPLYVLEKYLVFHIFSGVGAYKLLLYGLTLAALLAFFALLRRFAGTALAAAATLFVALALQMRGYHDALYSYNGMVQIMLLLLFASLWCWQRYLEGGSPAFAAAALVLYAVNGLTYEFSYLFFLLYGLVAPPGKRLAVVRASAPFAAISLVLAATSVVLRMHATLGDQVYAIGADPTAYVTALARQVSAALPLSYYVWNPSRIFPPIGNVFDRTQTYAVSLTAAVLVALAAALLLLRFARVRDAAGSGRLPSPQLVAFGAGLWVLPALIMAASPKYQHELVWGIGYLPVLIECFGVGLLIALGLRSLLARIGPRPAAAAVAGVALGSGFCGAVTLADNQRLALELEPWRTSRDAVAAALRRGVLADVPQNATLHFTGPLPWICYPRSACPDDLDVRYFVYAESGRRLDAAPGGSYAVTYGTTPRLGWVWVRRVGGAGAVVYVQAQPGMVCSPAIAPPQPDSAAWTTTVDQGQGWVVGRINGRPRRLRTDCGTIPFPGS